MKSILSRLFLIVVIGWAVFSHYLSYFNAKRLVYADFDHQAEAAGSGAYDVKEVSIDSIRYHGREATIYYLLTATYQNGSIKNSGATSYNAEPATHVVRHGFFGWGND